MTIFLASQLKKIYLYAWLSSHVEGYYFFFAGLDPTVL